MTSGDMKAALATILEKIFNADRHDLIPTVYGDRVKMVDGSHAARLQGKHDRTLDHSAVLEEIKLYRDAFSDLTYTIDAMVAEGDTVACRWHAEGTHDGPLGGFAATKRKVCISAVSFCRFEQDRVVEIWQMVDQHALHHQLGM